jgi:hypothetical protein
MKTSSGDRRPAIRYRVNHVDYISPTYVCDLPMAPERERILFD